MLKGVADNIPKSAKRHVFDDHLDQLQGQHREGIRTKWW